MLLVVLAEIGVVCHMGSEDSSALLSGDIDRYGQRLVTLDSPPSLPVYGRTHFITQNRPLAPSLGLLQCAVEKIRSCGLFLGGSVYNILGLYM